MVTHFALMYESLPSSNLASTVRLVATAMIICEENIQDHLLSLCWQSSRLGLNPQPINLTHFALLTEKFPSSLKCQTVRRNCNVHMFRKFPRYSSFFLLVEQQAGFESTTNKFDPFCPPNRKISFKFKAPNSQLICAENFQDALLSFCWQSSIVASTVSIGRPHSHWEDTLSPQSM